MLEQEYLLTHLVAIDGLGHMGWQESGEIVGERTGQVTSSAVIYKPIFAGHSYGREQILVETYSPQPTAFHGNDCFR